MADMSAERNRMVDTQIANRGIRDRHVLDAMRKVPREKFVSRGYEALAYQDGPLPIGHGQTISQPYIVALMIEAAEVRPGDRVLDVGAGSGYAAAVMAEIAEHVDAIERHAELGEIGEERLRNAGYDNVDVHVADGTLGWPEGAPFDAIIVAAGGPSVPPALKEQLREGGRLVIPVGDTTSLGAQMLLKVTRRGPDTWSEERLSSVRFVPLVGAQGWAEDGRRPSESGSSASSADRRPSSAAPTPRPRSSTLESAPSPRSAPRTRARAFRTLGRSGSEAVSRFTVLGGTGFVGSRVVRHLIEDGHRVRVAARHPERSDLLASGLVEPVRADLLEPATLSAALAGAEGAVNATSLYIEKDDLRFGSVHVEGAARFAKLAREAGTRRLVHISGIGSRPEAADPYIRARGEGEAAVRAAFPAATIVRPSAMFGEGDALLSAILTTARRLPAYPLFGRGETRLQPVHVDDVARGIARVLQVEEVAPTYEFAGPRVYTYRELVEAVAAAAGLTLRPFPVPFPIWHGLAWASESLPGAPLTRSQVALVEEDNVAAEGMPGLQDLGVSPQDIADFVERTEGRGT